MRVKMAWMLVWVMVVAVCSGCPEKKQEPVTAAPVAEPLPLFPEDQVPPPEPQPAPTVAVAQPAPPVDTAVTAEEPAPRRQQPKESYAPPAKAQRSYTVRQGDTLQKVAKKFYGTTKKWRTIYNANKTILKGGPDKLQPGMKLVIP